MEENRIDIKKIKKRITLGGDVGESPAIPLDMLCDEVQRNRKILGRLISWLIRELGQDTVQALLKELYPEPPEEKSEDYCYFCRKKIKPENINGTELKTNCCSHCYDIVKDIGF